MVRAAPKTPLLRGANVRRDEVGEGICRRVFGTFCGQKVHKLPRAETAVNRRPKSGKEQPAKRAKCFDGEGMRTLADYSR